MTLYFLEENYGLENDDNPWDPWYDKCFSMVVRANSEEEARKIAAEHNSGEGEQAWLDPKYSSCEVLLEFGESECIIRNEHWA